MSSVTPSLVGGGLGRGRPCGCVFELRERSPELFPGPTQARVDGVELAPEHGGDLGWTQTLELGEHVDLAALRGQLVDRRGDPGELLPGVDPLNDRADLFGLGQGFELALVSLVRAPA